MGNIVKRRQADRRREAEAKLIEAAIELVAENGYEAFSLAQVGERAGFSRGLPAHYFGSKDLLLTAAAEQIVAIFIQRIEERPLPKGGIEPIFAVLRGIAQSNYHRRPASRALYVIISSAIVKPGLVKAVQRLNKTSINWAVNVLQIAIENGLVRKDIDVYSEAASIVAFHRGCTAFFNLDLKFAIAAVTENFIKELALRLLIAE